MGFSTLIVDVVYFSLFQVGVKILDTVQQPNRNLYCHLGLGFMSFVCGLVQVVIYHLVIYGFVLCPFLAI